MIVSPEALAVRLGGRSMEMEAVKDFADSCMDTTCMREGLGEVLGLVVEAVAGRGLSSVQRCWLGVAVVMLKN